MSADSSDDGAAISVWFILLFILAFVASFIALCLFAFLTAWAWNAILSLGKASTDNRRRLPSKGDFSFTLGLFVVFHLIIIGILAFVRAENLKAVHPSWVPSPYMLPMYSVAGITGVTATITGILLCFASMVAVVGKLGILKEEASEQSPPTYASVQTEDLEIELEEDDNGEPAREDTLSKV